MTELLNKYSLLIADYAAKYYRECFREADGQLKHPFIVPGSCYSNCLWDWDSWLTNLALRNIDGAENIGLYEQGCILNFLEHIDENGRIPVYVLPDESAPLEMNGEETNIHKPCLAQHALFVTEQNGNDASWIAAHFPAIEKFIGWYETKCLHESGLFFWLDDFAIGVDNDPGTFYRPRKSSGSIYLNCLMYRELQAVAALAGLLGYPEKRSAYEKKAQCLKEAVLEHCWDERDGFFYNADLNLLPVDPNQWLHEGCPRHWNTLIQRIGVWSGFLAMWAGIATPEQASRMVKEHYLNEKTFYAPYGVRTLSKMEKMYAVIKSGNPSCWLGPVWGISNYMVFDGLQKYGYTEEARELAEKNVTLFGSDIERCGEMHEYYDPETGAGVNNPGFQNWNLLALNMIKWLRNNE